MTARACYIRKHQRDSGGIMSPKVGNSKQNIRISGFQIEARDYHAIGSYYLNILGDFRLSSEQHRLRENFITHSNMGGSRIL